MKNIHILPKNSKVKTLGIGLELGINNSIFFNGESQNIYITSNEKIKVNDYITDGFKVWKWKDDSSLLGRMKIILTSDDNLIKDSVQCVENEFLEWLIKNQDCEYVRVGISFLNEDDITDISTDYEIFYSKQIKCYDKFNQILSDGDYVDVQKDGVHQIYAKEDKHLYFKPYGKEDKVSAYFSNDIVKSDKDGNWLTNDTNLIKIMNSNPKTKSNKAKVFKESKSTFLTVFIDDFGSLVSESESKYKVTLSGSYSWCFVGKCWRHEIKSIIPKIPLSYILSDTILTN